LIRQFNVVVFIFMLHVDCAYNELKYDKYCDVESITMSVCESLESISKLNLKIQVLSSGFEFSCELNV